MADTKTSDETAATAPTGAELVRIVQGGSSKKTTLAVAGHQFRGARARMTSDDTAQNVTTLTAVVFDAAEFDTDSFWSAGSPTRLTIPAGLGITHVELAGQVNTTASTADTYLSVEITHYNSAGTILNRILQFGSEFGATTKVAAMGSGPLAVTAGDYFELRVQEESDTSVTIQGGSTTRCFLALHVIGMEPV